MTRDAKTSLNRVALLATGDEIIHGDILNTNAQLISQRLFCRGIPVGMQIAVSDHMEEIEQSIKHLLSHHRALIITGGLGPTSDDITRYALSHVIDRPLVFDEETWQMICDRFRTLGYQGEPPPGNLQQAEFPEGAFIIRNPQGTASGCVVEHHEKMIFMLPGPPSECLPMVDSVVLPTLIQKKFQEIFCYESWYLFGIGESLIASKLDALAKPFDCTTGYRIAFPYIEFKVYSNNKKDFDALVPILKNHIEPYLFNEGKEYASAQLIKKIKSLSSPVRIADSATGGLLESTLLSPDTFQNVIFSQDKPQVIITGLKEYWENHDTAVTNLEIKFPNDQTMKKEIPLRGRGSRVKQYAVELICYHVLKFLS